MKQEAKSHHPERSSAKERTDGPDPFSRRRSATAAPQALPPKTAASRNLQKKPKQLSHFSAKICCHFQPHNSPQTHHDHHAKNHVLRTRFRKTPCKTPHPPRKNKSYKIYRERSWSFTIEATCCRTYSGSTTITFSTPVAVCRSITGSGGEATCGSPVSGADAPISPTTPSSVISARGLLNRSGAWKLISSSTRSRIVCNRRAPIFSVVSFTRNANCAISAIASFVNSNFNPSVSSSAVDCFTSDDFGSVKILTKSFTVSDCNSTRIGKRPCNSGIKSLGFDT